MSNGRSPDTSDLTTGGHSFEQQRVFDRSLTTRQACTKKQMVRKQTTVCVTGFKPVAANRETPEANNGYNNRQQGWKPSMTLTVHWHSRFITKSNNNLINEIDWWSAEVCATSRGESTDCAICSLHTSIRSIEEWKQAWRPSAVYTPEFITTVTRSV